MKTKVVGASIVLLASLSGCGRASPTGVAFDKAIREPSGLTASVNHAGVWWTHGDSGTGNWLFAVDAKGSLLARLRVRGAQNVDWEDITHDDTGRLWLGDMGNNDSGRHDLRVYRLPEVDPSQAEGEVTAELSLSFHYPEQVDFGDKYANFDAESLFWWRDQLWLLTKHRGDDRTRLYRFPRLVDEPEGESIGLEQVASFDLGPWLTDERKKWSGQVSGAEVAPDGRHLAVLSYEAVFIFAMPDSGEGGEVFDVLVTRIALDEGYTRQVEAVSWDGERLMLVNEDRAVFVIGDPLTCTSYPA